MTLASELDASDKRNRRTGDVVLGEDWEDPARRGDKDLSERRARRGIISLNRSALARKIITFNLLALVILVAGVLYLNPARTSLVEQRNGALLAESELIASVLEARVRNRARLDETENGAPDEGLPSTLDLLALSPGVEVFVFDGEGNVLETAIGEAPSFGTESPPERSTLITDFLNNVWETVSGALAPALPPESELPNSEDVARDAAQMAMVEGTRVHGTKTQNDEARFTVGTPIMLEGKAVGAVVVVSAAGEIDRLVRRDREQVLQMFVVALLVSIGLSLALASTIANPLADLAEAAELGRDKNARKISPSRVRIPDLTARPDEIGRLSGALRGMVTALYDRIDANEQFAADVAHEIKNPLASLRSAVGTLRVAKREDHREKLLDVIDHDVRRLDRLVSDISNASRLDSELVREEEEPFDLLHMLGNINQYLGEEAKSKGIDFISDLPDKPITVMGLEARLAQVFVNLITNAISFCGEGDAIRVWARKRENRILIVVEDTGPGIPDQALHKIFNRFYSERPSGQFGNNSGLGLAISKQIVEAHDGVIWAENIRPTESDVSSEPLGARFVVGLPV